jgi:hypothetical protein
MTDMTERNKILDERFAEKMEADFNPQHRPEHMPEPDKRLARAAEYAAYQLGQINRKLDILIEAIQAKT